jgi:hypothetical protein
MACACYQDLLESQLGACLIDPITYEVLEDPVVAPDGLQLLIGFKHAKLLRGLP